MKLILSSADTTNTNLLVFGWSRSGLEHTIYRNESEHDSHYTNDAVYIYISSEVKSQRD